MGAALYVCRGCGREAADHVADLEAMRARGFISCCPEREVVQVGPCLFPQPKFIKSGGRLLLTGGLAGDCFRADHEADVYLLGVKGLDAPGVLPRGGSASFPLLANSYELTNVNRGRR